MMSNKKFIDYYGLETIFNYPALCSLLFFVVYWAAPFALLGITNILSNTQEDTVNHLLPYLGDLTHLFFASIVSIGSFFAAKMCGIINQNKDKIVCYDKYEDEVIATRLSFLKLSNSYGIKIIALVIGIITAIIVTNIILAEDSWWGISEGAVNAAGILFVVNTSAMVFLGVSVFMQISLRSILVSLLAARFIQIDFFHSDGCNGQKEVGNLIMYGWALSITCVSSVFILYYMGYLGIEDSVIAAVIAFILIFSIPMISIFPLIAIVRSVNKEKARAINKLNNESKIGEKLHKKQESKNLKTNLDVDEYFALRGYIDSVNVWPFNMKAISVVVIAYMVQSVLVMDQLIGVMQKWWLS